MAEARRLGVTTAGKTTIHRWIKRGELSSKIVGGITYVLAEELQLKQPVETGLRIKKEAEPAQERTPKRTVGEDEVGRYYSYQRKDGSALELGADTVLRIKAYYTAAAGGANFTRDQVCRKFNLTRADLMLFTAAEKLTKTDLPVLNEDVASADFDDDAWVEQRIVQAKGSLERKFNQRRQRDLVKMAGLWHDRERSIHELIRHAVDDIKEIGFPKAPRVSKRKRGPSSGNLSIVGLTDYHVGKHGATHEPMLEALERFDEYRVDTDEIVLLIGSDNLNVDGAGSKTTRGTPQPLNGEFRDVVRYYVQMKAKLIAWARARARHTRLVCVPGNHDESVSWTLAALYESVYADADDVSVLIDGYYPSIKHGCNGIVLHHGQGTSDSNKLAAVCAARREIWGTTTHNYAYTGHHHHRFSKEAGGVLHTKMPSLSMPDTWHDLSYPVGGLPGAELYVHNDKRGRIMTVHV